MTANSQELIQAVEQATSSESLFQAVKDLAAARQEAAIPTLVKVLGYNNPGVAVAAVEGLITLGEPAVSYLLNHLDGYDYGARAWATRALAGIGDPRALELLLEAAKGDFALSVRRAATKGLGSLRWSQVPQEQIQTVQRRVYETLAAILQDPEWVVRYAAVVGLQALAAAAQPQPNLGMQILNTLEHAAATDSEGAVCARAQYAQFTLG